RFGQVFVAVKTNRHADPGFGAVARTRIFRRGCRSDDPQNTAPAADRHAFSQGDLGGHAERKEKLQVSYSEEMIPKLVICLHLEATRVVAWPSSNEPTCGKVGRIRM